MKEGWVRDGRTMLAIMSGWDRFGSVRFRFPGTGEFPVPGSVRFLGI